MSVVLFHLNYLNMQSLIAMRSEFVRVEVTERGKELQPGWHRVNKSANETQHYVLRTWCGGREGGRATLLPGYLWTPNMRGHIFDSIVLGDSHWHAIMISKVGSARQQQHFFLSLRQIIRSDGGGGGHLARRCVGMCHQKENPRESENNDLKSTSCYTLTSFRSGAWHRLTTKRSSLFRNSKQIFFIPKVLFLSHNRSNTRNKA